jgi:hypothetical protein
VVETGQRHLRLSIFQDDLIYHRSFLFTNHLYRFFLLDNLFRCSSKGRRNRGYSGMFSVVGILILIFILGIFSHAIKFGLLGDLSDELVMRLDHSFKGGHLFLQLLTVFAQLIA